MIVWITTIVGIVGSVILSYILSLCHERRKRNNLKHITLKYIDSEYYGIKGKGDVKMILNYKGTTIETPIVVLKLRIINDGNFDIKYNSVFTTPLTFHFPGFNLLSVNAKDDSEVFPSVEIKKNDVLVRWDILKRK